MTQAPPSPSTLDQDAGLIEEIEKRTNAAAADDGREVWEGNVSWDESQRPSNKTTRHGDAAIDDRATLLRLLKSRQPHVTLHAYERTLIDGARVGGDVTALGLVAIIDRLCLTKAESER